MSEDDGHLDAACIAPDVPGEETVDLAAIVDRCPILTWQAAGQ